MVGRVVSVKMKNTAVVLVETPKLHPVYNKSFLRTKKYNVDDQIGVALGDIVEIIQCRPISKTKNWKVVKVVGRDLVALGTEELKESATEAIAEVLPEEVSGPEVAVEGVKEEEKREVDSKKEKRSKSKVKKEDK